MMETLKDKIYKRFFEKPEPLFILNDITLPSASLWVGIRQWVLFFRKHNIKKGDRILISIPFNIEFLFIIFACFWEEITVFLLNPNNYNENKIIELDCCIQITEKLNKHSVVIEDYLPIKIIENKRRLNLKPNFDVLLFLQSSGSTGNPKWIGLSELNILSVLDSHIRKLEYSNIIALSILPHFHAFGLIIELLIFIFTSSIIIRDEKDGKDPENIIKLIDKWNVTHLNGVPLTIEKILSLPKGTDYLRNLKGGIIGGASITEKISSYLFGSNLRVGYGQTEASPGITLGEFGILYTNFLGNEVGCEVKIKEGELLFKGNNNFNSLFTGDFQDFSKERWIETGDIVEKKDNGYYFVSRKDFLIKLNNGKMLYPEKLELELKNKISQITEICIIPSKNNRVLILYNSLQENLNDRIFTYLPDYLKKNSEIKFLKKSISITPKGAVDRKKIILEADSFETISIFTGR